jgi:hypothetical protein
MAGSSVAGPTLAGAGLGYLIPLTELRPAPVGVFLERMLEEQNLCAMSYQDKSFAEMVWVAFFVSLGAWMYSLYLILPGNAAGPALMVNWSVVIGGAVFFGSVLLSESRERGWMKW